MRLLWVLTLLILVAVLFVDGKKRLYVASEGYRYRYRYRYRVTKVTNNTPGLKV